MWFRRMNVCLCGYALLCLRNLVAHSRVRINRVGRRGVRASTGGRGGWWWAGYGGEGRLWGGGGGGGWGGGGRDWPLIFKDHPSHWLEELKLKREDLILVSDLKCLKFSLWCKFVVELWFDGKEFWPFIRGNSVEIFYIKKKYVKKKRKATATSSLWNRRCSSHLLVQKIKIKYQEPLIFN